MFSMPPNLKPVQCGQPETKSTLSWTQCVKSYVCNVDQLKYIKSRVDHDRKLRILDYKACVNIRKFRISRKKTRRGGKAGNEKYREV